MPDMNLTQFHALAMQAASTANIHLEIDRRDVADLLTLFRREPPGTQIHAREIAAERIIAGNKCTVKTLVFDFI